MNDELTIRLAEDEHTKVDRRKRSTRPQFYDAVAGVDVTISADFEAFLILLPSPVKVRIAEYIKTLSKPTSTRPDRDELMVEFLTDDLAQTKATVEELRAAIAVYSSFRTEYSTGKFGGVPEVSRLTSDLSRGMPEVTEAYDSAVYHYTHANIVLQRHQVGKFWGEPLSDQQKRQLQSWLRCILAYV